MAGYLIRINNLPLFPLFSHLFPMKWWEPDAMISVFWRLSFKPIFSLFSFTFIKRLFSSSSLSAIRVVSSAYLRLLIFLPAILIPACASSSPAFLMMYSAHKLNKQGDNIQPWRSLDVLLFLFGTSLFFHVWFWLWLLDLHADFSGGSSGVTPYLISTVCCDPHSQRLWCSQ